jgi:2-polyprenyl-6-hydroxyphenyl methylase/3-demethylubiquinone-9 3-methyltransferase
MTATRKRYDPDHWLRSHDSKEALAAYMEQQSKAYSRVKNAQIAELIGDLKGKRFLDYGCGGGMFTVHAAKEGAAVVLGVDAEETALSTARYFAQQEEVEHQCSFLRSETFPSFPPQKRFDVILIKDVIEHVTDDQALLDAAARAITPGGVIVLSTQNSLSLNYLIEGTYQRHIRGNKAWCGWDPTHLRFYTPPKLGRKLVNAGFSPVAWRSAYIVPYKLPAPRGSNKQFLRLDPLSWIDLTVGKMFPFNRVGWNISVRAEASSLVAQEIQGRAPLRKGLLPLADLGSRSANRNRTASPETRGP